MINLIDVVINVEEDKEKEKIEKKIQSCISSLLSFDPEADSLLVVYIDMGGSNAKNTQKMSQIIAEKLLANGIYKFIIVPKDLVEIKQIRVIKE